ACPNLTALLTSTALSANLKVSSPTLIEFFKSLENLEVPFATLANPADFVDHLAALVAKDVPPVAQAQIPSDTIAPAVKDNPPKTLSAQKLAVINCPPKPLSVSCCV